MIYNAGEILQFAVQIENNGELFYKQLSENIKDEKIKALFARLSEEEVVHKKTFQALLNEKTRYEPKENFPEEYFAYLKSFSDSLIFSSKKVREETDNMNDIVKAVEFAMRRETDSILYYYEIRELVIENDRSSINRIISEERKHYTQLSDLRKELIK
jgi:rubrerythrin